MTLSDIHKELYSISIAPKNNPNADAYKVLAMMNRKYIDNYDYVQSYLESQSDEYKNWFVVKVEKFFER